MMANSDICQDVADPFLPRRAIVVKGTREPRPRNGPGVTDVGDAHVGRECRHRVRINEI